MVTVAWHLAGHGVILWIPSEIFGVQPIMDALLQSLLGSLLASLLDLRSVCHLRSDAS